MKKKPLISVFIPVYNCEEYIEQAVQSILAQTYKNIEVILVDDCSTDRTCEVINSIQDSRIYLYKNSCNMGIPYTRNRGLELARGEYLAFLDADDYSYPLRLEHSLRFLQENPEYKIVAGNYDRLINGKLEHSGDKGYGFYNASFETLFRMPVLTSTMMIDMELVQRHKIDFPIKYYCMQDYAFLALCLPYSKVGMLKEKLSVYRIGHASITNVTQKNVKKMMDRKSFFKEINRTAFNGLGITVTDEEHNLHIKMISSQGKEADEEALCRWFDLLERIVDSSQEKEQTSVICKKRFITCIKNSKVKQIKMFHLSALRFHCEPITATLKGWVKVIFHKRRLGWQKR